MNNIFGKAASPGIALGHIFKIEKEKLNISKKHIDNIDKEFEKLEQAIKKATFEIEKLAEKTNEKLGKEHAAIFQAHKEIAKDPAFLSETKLIIESEKVNADFAYQTVASKFIEMFSQMDDAYMKERASDIKDVSTRVLNHILGIEIKELSTIDKDTIIVAEDLTPSQTAQLNSFVKGFVTKIGGSTSHSAIMARSLEIPAIVGAETIMGKAIHNKKILIDGESGEIILDPSKKDQEAFIKKAKDQQKQKAQLEKLINKESITIDGHKVKIESNIGTIEDVKQALKYGAEGVGLFRSEFLYMNSSNWPDEEKQFNCYKAVLEKMGKKAVVIRTLDIGGDKTLPYYKFPEEMNPFLGYRAIRLCLDQEEVFRTQLRALLRASNFGNLKIMFPLIATVDEFLKAKSILEDEHTKLEKIGTKIGKYETGMMMEIPAAVLLADKFAKISDFFSIGTNDLLQYTFAADRMNGKISYLHQPLNPSNLRAVKATIDAAHNEGKWVGMCGEMAGDPQAIKILLGLGLDDFSMSATSMLKARSIIRNTTLKEAQKLAKKAIDCTTEKEVKNLIKIML